MNIVQNLPCGIVYMKPDAIHQDLRGTFFEARRNHETYKLLGKNFVQVNVSKSTAFVLRGLHYQLGRPQGKLMRCLFGKIFQVAVDVRRHSQTFGSYWSRVLDDQINESVYIPPGFANGFYTFENGAIVMYELTEPYNAQLDKALLWDDQQVGIRWPFGHNITLIISPRDRQAKHLNEIERWSAE